MSVQTHDILAAITEAQGALYREPEYKARIHSLESELSRSLDHTRGLELNIAGYKADISELQSKVRSLEVERDDAGFRELEANDVLARVLSLVATGSTYIKDAQAIMIEREKTAADSASAASEAKPTEAQHVNITEAAQGDTSMPINAAVDNIPSGQSAADPTVTSSKDSTYPTAATAEGEATPNAPFKPYEGKNWSEVLPRVYDRYEWDNGGGSDLGW